MCSAWRPNFNFIRRKSYKRAAALFEDQGEWVIVVERDEFAVAIRNEDSGHQRPHALWYIPKRYTRTRRKKCARTRIAFTEYIIMISYFDRALLRVAPRARSKIDTSVSLYINTSVRLYVYMNGIAIARLTRNLAAAIVGGERRMRTATLVSHRLNLLVELRAMDGRKRAESSLFQEGSSHQRHGGHHRSTGLGDR